mmetsp:Transcript_33032/g.69494  ORF Transcript_33032/g.69494 Transcript_33032/m.69494 type:complete len:311 (-) Transcript_33032:36-968(-)
MLGARGRLAGADRAAQRMWIRVARGFERGLAAGAALRGGVGGHERLRLGRGGLEVRVDAGRDEGEEAAEVLVGRPRRELAEQQRREEEQAHDLDVAEDGGADRRERAHRLEEYHVVDDRDAAAAEQEADGGSGTQRQRLEKDVELGHERKRHQHDEGDWAGIEGHLERVELARAAAHDASRERHLYALHHSGGEGQDDAQQRVARLLPHREHDADGDDDEADDLALGGYLGLDADGEHRHEHRDGRADHLVHRELHHGERGVVARDLEAVHRCDNREALPVVLQHQRMARGVVLAHQHERREGGGAEDHV